MTDFSAEIDRRRTFAIISHPDAGKTTLTEKLLWFGGAIQVAGEVRARKASRHATSDWMELEKQRGISVTSSVMQFPYRDCMINLLDTPGHEDFSEDTYRTLTAVDSAVMVIDSVKGVEERTIKLLDVCRLRDTPILTFINKLDREGRSPIDLLDEIESVLKIQCAPITWPIGMGKGFRGVYHLVDDSIAFFDPTQPTEKGATSEVIQGLDNPRVDELLGSQAGELRMEIELVRGASHSYDRAAYLAGKQCPVFFGSAVNNFGVRSLLDAVVDMSPHPQSRATLMGNIARDVDPHETKFSGFVFKIQANMDPKHRDRIAFLRVCSGRFERGMKLKQVAGGKTIAINNAITFMARDRSTTDEAYAGDIIGIPNHGTIRLGETFTEGESLRFTGIPSFAPEYFQRAILKNPLKLKQLQKGLQQLAEEGATQLFRPDASNELILGAVGTLQFDVVAYRLKDEYDVDAVFESCAINTARWIKCSDEDFRKLADLYPANVGTDGAGDRVYLASSRVNLQLAQERFPAIQFAETREVH